MVLVVSVDEKKVKLLTRRQVFEKRGKCKHGHCSILSDHVWTDLILDCTVLKLLDMCGSSGLKCRKQLNFSPKNYMLEGGSIRSKLKKALRGIEKAWNSFFKPALKIASPYIGMPASTKTKTLRLDKQQLIF